MAVLLLQLQQLCSAPLTRTVRLHSVYIPSRRISACATAVSVPSRSTSNSHIDPHVLLGMSEKDLQQLSVDLGQQSYRGKQLHHLLYKNKAKEIHEFSHLPQAFRNDLQEAGWKVGRSPVHRVVTASDGTIKVIQDFFPDAYTLAWWDDLNNERVKWFFSKVKLGSVRFIKSAKRSPRKDDNEVVQSCKFSTVLLKLEDNKVIETVGIPVEDDKGSSRLTACVSSQVGCPLRCSFCATGKGGYSRNLQRHEIIEQVLVIEELFKRRVSNVVFMGMGEPMLNLKAVLEAHRCLNKDIQIGQRMITISTVGVPNTMKKLASHKLQSTLAISLHAPNQQLRETIVPSAKSYPLDAIMKDCKDYFLETGRRVSFEYTLLAGVNDKVEHAVELAELIHNWGSGYHVNLIPYNPVDGSEYRRPYKKAVLAFSAALESRKVTVSVRQTRGLDASAACGQLRNEFQKSPLLLDSVPEPEEASAALAV